MTLPMPGPADHEGDFDPMDDAVWLGLTVVTQGVKPSALAKNKF